MGVLSSQRFSLSALAAVWCKGRNTAASFALKSRLVFSIGIHVTFLALVSPRNESEKCHVCYNGKSETGFERECCCVSTGFYGVGSCVRSSSYRDIAFRDTYSSLCVCGVDAGTADCVSGVDSWVSRLVISLFWEIYVSVLKCLSPCLWGKWSFVLIGIKMA